MGFIWLGIKDYCKDCWHDWLIRRLFKLFYSNKPHALPDLWKKGSVWHYIQYHRLKKKVEQIKQLRKEYEEQKKGKVISDENL